MRFERLSRGQLLAALAALALLFTMAADWWGSRAGDEARRVESTVNTRGAESGEVGRAVQADAQAVAEREERNAWQADGLVDRVILFVLLLTIACALAGAALRAAGRRSRPPWSPTFVAVAGALVGGLLVAYRIVQEPGVDASTTVKVWPLMAVLALAVVAVGSAGALQAEYDWADMRAATRTPREGAEREAEQGAREPGPMPPASRREDG